MAMSLTDILLLPYGLKCDDLCEKQSALRKSTRAKQEEVINYGYALEKSTKGCFGCFAWSGGSGMMPLPWDRKVCSMLDCGVNKHIIKDPNNLGVDNLHSILATLNSAKDVHL